MDRESSASSETPASSSGGLRFMVRALSYRNYRLFFVGQGTSLIGSWMTRIATSWLIYRLTKSVWLLGIVGFAGQIPMFLLAPAAGVLIDRWDRRRTLVVTQVLAMIQSCALAYFALRGTIGVPHIIVLSVFQGVINAFDNPARQAFVSEMVDRPEDLANAIALNSSMIHSSRLIGPSIAGFVIARVGEGWCFMVDGISYLAVIASLLMMRVPAMKPRRQRHVLVELREGFAHSYGFPPVRDVLLMVSLVSMLGMSYTVLLPVIAGRLRPDSPTVFGFLMGCAGVGALVGAIYLASRRSVLGLGRVIVIAATLVGIGLVGMALSQWLWLSAITLLVVGFGSITALASSNTFLQTITDSDKRGRVMSFFAMSFLGVAPFGSLLAGELAARIGTPWTLACCGMACLLGAGWFSSRLPILRKLVHPIYVRKGIIREIADGVEAAAELTVPPER